MVFVRFLLVAFGLICLFRCPLIGQGLADKLRTSSGLSSKRSCSNLIKSFSRNYNLKDNGQTYLSVGLRYDRATTLANGGQWVLERQARAGLPLLAGYRLGRFVVEAGGFFGVDMCRSQDAVLFGTPAESGRDFNRANGLLLGMGMQLFDDCKLNLQYTHLDDLPENMTLGRINLGWQWTW